MAFGKNNQMFIFQYYSVDDNGRIFWVCYIFIPEFLFNWFFFKRRRYGSNDIIILYFLCSNFPSNFPSVGYFFEGWIGTCFERIWRKMGSSIWIHKNKKQVDKNLQFDFCIEKIFIRYAMLLQKLTTNNFSDFHVLKSHVWNLYGQRKRHWK